MSEILQFFWYWYLKGRENYLLIWVNKEYSNKVFLDYKDVNFIQEAYDASSSTAKPRFYAQFDSENFILGPTPNSNYAIELHYYYRPTSITAGADSGTTWISTNAPFALLYGPCRVGWRPRRPATPGCPASLPARPEDHPAQMFWPTFCRPRRATARLARPLTNGRRARRRSARLAFSSSNFLRQTVSAGWSHTLSLVNLFQ